MDFTGLPPKDVPALMNGIVKPHPTIPGRFDAYLPSPVAQSHASNLAFLKDGTLTCVWFGGTMEGMGDVSIYLSRLAPGADRWSEPEKMTDDPLKSEQNPLIFTAPNGDVWLVYTSQTSGDQDGAVVKCRVSKDGGKSFGAVRTLFDTPGTFVRQAIVVNNRGDWLLPGFACVSLPGQPWRGDADTALVLISRDQGESWKSVAVPDSLGAVHMNIVAGQGDEMVAFYRNRYSEHVLASHSTDGGESWSAPQPIDLPSNNSSIQATRLQDGAIAMVYNHANAESSGARRASLYDEIDGNAPRDGETAVTAERKAVWGVPRAPLSLAISRDNGRSFPTRIDIDTGDGYCLSNNSKDFLNREFSYPTIVQGADGALHMAYTYYRLAIKYVRLEQNARP